MSANAVGASPWERVRRTAVTTALVVLVLLDGLLTAGFYQERRLFEAGLPSTSGAPPLRGAPLVLLLGVLVLPAVVLLRKQLPVVVALVGAVAAVVAYGPTLALVGLVAVILRASSRAAWATAIVVAGATVYRAWDDTHVEPRSGSFWGTLLAIDAPDLPWFSAPVIALSLFGGPVAMGLWLKARQELTRAEGEVADERRQVSALTEQVAKQAERERLAREIHDGVGHRLSLLSLHAGALEATTRKVAARHPDDEDVDRIAQSAGLVRASASDSVTELHSLLDLLRRPEGPDIAAPTKTMADLGELVDESVRAGMRLVSTVSVDDADAVDPLIAQATYRIVQELLTNARKHAHGVQVRLMVTGGPEDGVEIAAANPVPEPTHGTQKRGPRDRAGTGLVGIGERAERHGGEMVSGPDGHGAFRVSVRLPWQSRLTTGGQ